MTSDPSRCRWSFAGRRAIARATWAPVGCVQSTGTESVAHCRLAPHPFQAIVLTRGPVAAPAGAGIVVVAMATSATIRSARRRDKAATVPIECLERPPGAVPSDAMTPRDHDGEPPALST